MKYLIKFYNNNNTKGISSDDYFYWFWISKLSILNNNNFIYIYYLKLIMFNIYIFFKWVIILQFICINYKLFNKILIIS